MWISNSQCYTLKMSDAYEFRVAHARELTLQEQREPQQLIQKPPMVTLALKEEEQVSSSVLMVLRSQHPTR